MAPPLLIALQCSDRKVVQEVDNYSHLQAQCNATFLPYAREGNALDLCYSIPVSYLNADASSPNRARAASYLGSSSARTVDFNEECVVSYVRCPASFDTFLHVWENCLRPLQMQYQDHILPTLYVVQGAPLTIPDGAPLSSPLLRPTSTTTDPSLTPVSTSASTRTKAALPPAHSATSGTTSSYHSPIVMGPHHTTTTPPQGKRLKAALPNTNNASADNGQVASTNSCTADEDMVVSGGFSADLHASTPNAKRAQVLLDSFGPAPTNQVVPVIRATMRCGEASVLVPFNARNPPKQRKLLDDIREAMLLRLRETEANIAANSPSRQRGAASTVSRAAARLEEASMAALNIPNPSDVVFVVSMFLPKSAAEGCDVVDVDDDGDVALLAEATLEAGNDFSTYLIVESHERSDPSALSLPNSFFFGEVVPHIAPLTFNRASSPVRHHVILDAEDY